MRLPLILASLYLAGGCCSAVMESNATAAPKQATAKVFHRYWSQGKAELTSYDLQQARYGELHAGHAVLIFVREDLSASKQVKLDAPGRAGDDRVSVLKLNLTKKFNTGIYPYSVMQSVFTPHERDRHPRTLKMTMSSQEWCGHVFTQLNLGDDGYHSRSFSYFETEGDTDVVLGEVQLEDELWNLVRIDPSALPLGEAVPLVPGAVHARLRHVPMKVEAARATLAAGRFAGTDVLTYTIDYAAIARSLSIHFEEAFPHAIVGWEETHASGWGPGEKRLTTRATRKRSIQLDYWHKNSVSDLRWRKELDLD